MFAWPQGGSATPGIGPDGRVYTKLGELALGIHEPAGSAVEIGAEPGLIPYMSSRADRLRVTSDLPILPRNF